MKLAYSHNNGVVGARGTLVFVLPSKQDLQKLVSDCVRETHLKIGTTFLHPKEQFCKKLGRDEAEKHIVLVNADLNMLSIRDHQRLVYHFHSFVPDPRPNMNMETLIEFGFSISPTSERVHLEYAFFSENV
jgi:hypothetical protein